MLCLPLALTGRVISMYSGRGMLSIAGRTGS